MTARIFDCLSGRWHLNRLYTSYLASYPSGSAKGTAQFEKRCSNQAEALEYLYDEGTEFTPQNGQPVINGTQKYAYLLDTKTSKLSVHFVKRDADSAVERLFHEICFDQNFNLDGLVKATGEHFCSPDNYSVKYEFQFKNGELSNWTIEYRVQGPQKNYVMSTCYTRC